MSLLYTSIKLFLFTKQAAVKLVTGTTMKTVETKKNYILHAEKINTKYEIGYSHRVSFSSEHSLRLTASKSEFYFQIVFFLKWNRSKFKKTWFKMAPKARR
jgi:hypothetical protein